VLAFGFTEKCHFVAKTDRNFIFLGRKAQIPNWLQNMFPYISFYGLIFFKIFAQNSNEVAFRFTEKHQFAAKTDQTPYFLLVKPKF
jgi:hypothetical protein